MTAIVLLLALTSFVCSADKPLTNRLLTFKPTKLKDLYEKCEVYRKLDLLPSAFGFDRCQIQRAYEAKRSLGYAVKCYSSGLIHEAVFYRARNGQRMACEKKTRTAYRCSLMPKSSDVCDCTTKCSKFNILRNLPVSPPIKSNKVISFSLFGNKKILTCGALAQARLVKLFYPGWTPRFYVNSSVPREIVKQLKQEAEVVEILDRTKLFDSGYFWRFLAAGDPNVKIYCFRDVDGPLSHREAKLVSAWLASGKPFHAIRDHYYQNTHFIPGSVCGRLPIVEIRNEIEQYRWKGYRADEDLISKFIFPEFFEDNVVSHDRTQDAHFFMGKSRPIKIEQLGMEYINMQREISYESNTAICKSIELGI